MVFSHLAKLTSRPATAIASVALGIIIGLTLPAYSRVLQPVGELYLALLQVCVLPFLLVTIPLAIHSALSKKAGAGSFVWIAIWTVGSLVLLSAISVSSSLLMFRLQPLSAESSAQIGALVGKVQNSVDIEFALHIANEAPRQVIVQSIFGAIVPTNIFSALSANDALKVIVFSIIFGAGLSVSSSQGTFSVLEVLKHVQSACIIVFDWVNVMMPVGVVSLIAPQISQLGPGSYAVLAPFALSLVLAAAAIMVVAVLMMAASLRTGPMNVVASLLQPLALGAATRNAFICAPATLNVMTGRLQASKDTCNLFIPMGFALLRSGNIMHFIIATLYLGYLLDRPFPVLELFTLAALAFVASFATIGISGVAGLAPVAAVMQPFGLSYELALPLLIIIDPIVSIVRAMLNIAVGCQIAALAGGREPETVEPVPFRIF